MLNQNAYRDLRSWGLIFEFSTLTRSTDSCDAGGRRRRMGGGGVGGGGVGGGRGGDNLQNLQKVSRICVSER